MDASYSRWKKAIFLTSSGMMDGGPIEDYLKNLSVIQKLYSTVHDFSWKKHDDLIFYKNNLRNGVTAP
jgi:hypothetical protein